MKRCVAILLLALPWHAALLTAADPAMEDLVVTSQWRATPLIDVPASITALDAAAIEQAGVQHFEELTQLVPNLNWSGEGSRARYFQLRGTGELEQYEGAPNPSVGFVIDDIDFSGIGGAATLFDADRIEVLRGPQATRYGANALAGLIYYRTAEPSADAEAGWEATVGSDDSWSVGAAAGGPFAGTEDQLQFRVAAQLYQSNGFRDNVYLGRDDTNKRDEFTGRGKLRWLPDEHWQVDLTAMYVDLANGYDAFAIDNGFDTVSDRPGQDAQETLAGSLRVAGDLNRMLRFVSITAVASSDIVFSFDSDWSNPDFWAGEPFLGPCTAAFGEPCIYDYTSSTRRQRDTLSQEFRLLSTPDGRLFGQVDWLLGVYGLRLDEGNRKLDQGTDNAFCPGNCVTTVASDYRSDSLALFGELNWGLSDRLNLLLGLRAERREADYAEDFGFRSPGFEFSTSDAFDPVDRLWGGDLALNVAWTDSTTGYARVARGYKAGGFNIGLARADLGQPGAILGAEDIPFADEALWNYEIGLRHAADDGRWSADFALFWQQRDDMQVRIPFQVQPGDPNTFLFVTANAEQGRAWGAEAALRWQPFAILGFEATLGWLQTEVSEFSFVQRVAGVPGFEGLQNLVGRDFAHAPDFSYSLAAGWMGPAGWFARAELRGREAFYFDYGNDQRSEPYRVVNLQLGKNWQRWRIEASLRNAFDELYSVRGFYFGNEPPDFPSRLYLRRADPRQFVIALSYRF